MKLVKLDDENAVVHVRLREGWEADLLVVGLDAFQRSAKAWCDRRLPHRETVDVYANLAEEVGELGRAVCKGRQQIRFTAREIARMKREEAADVLLALLDFCALEGFSLAEAAIEVFAKKSTPTYDLVRAADKRRRDAANDLKDALSMNLFARLRDKSCCWEDPAAQAALRALAEAGGATREDIVREMSEHLESAAQGAQAGKEPTP